jgi:hypothetical protein
MQAWFKRFVVRPMAQTIAEATWFGFLFSAVLIAAMVNLATNALSAVVGPLWTVVLLALLLVATLVFSNLYARQIRRAIEQGERVIGGRGAPDLHRGLIVMPTRAPTARQAVDHHKGRLEHLWIIVTPEMREPAGQLRDYAESLGIACHPLELADEYDAPGCYRLVREIIQTHAPAANVPPGEIIADLTGGTKLMTAGMALACGDLNQALQYVPTQYVGAEPTVPFQPIEVTLGRAGIGG